MAAWGYGFYVLVLKVSLTNERSELLYGNKLVSHFNALGKTTVFMATLF